MWPTQTSLLHIQVGKRSVMDLRTKIQLFKVTSTDRLMLFCLVKSIDFALSLTVMNLMVLS